MKKLLFVFSLSILLLWVSPASASVWNLTANSIYTPEDPWEGSVFGDAVWWSDFTIVFNDEDDDNAVYIDDIEFFSGMNFHSDGRRGGPPYDYSFYGLANLANISIDGLTIVGDYSNPEQWNFIRDGGTNPYGESLWDYTASVVPLPGAAWLFGSAFIGLVGFRRKIKK